MRMPKSLCINVQRFISMADIEVKPRTVLPRDSRQVSLAQRLATCSRERMLKLLGSVHCQRYVTLRNCSKNTQFIGLINYSHKLPL